MPGFSVLSTTVPKCCQVYNPTWTQSCVRPRCWGTGEREACAPGRLPGYQFPSLTSPRYVAGQFRATPHAASETEYAHPTAGARGAVVPARLPFVLFPAQDQPEVTHARKPSTEMPDLQLAPAGPQPQPPPGARPPLPARLPRPLGLRASRRPVASSAFTPAASALPVGESCLSGGLRGPHKALLTAGRGDGSILPLPRLGAGALGARFRGLFQPSRESPQRASPDSCLVTRSAKLGPGPGAGPGVLRGKHWAVRRSGSRGRER